MSNPKKSGPSRLLPFFWGAVLGSGITALVLYLNRPAPPLPPPSTPTKVESAPAPCPEPRTAEATQSRDAKDFNFYGVLEQAPVPPVRPDLEQAPMPPNAIPPGAPHGGKPPEKTAAEARDERLYLQIASFKATADADALKARIALAGLTVEVIATDLGDKGTYHRVRVGPFGNQAEVDKARTQLSQAGVPAEQAIVVR
ncbi:MAG: SPOR domain-containing protein [Pseudomonadota bacterium]